MTLPPLLTRVGAARRRLPANVRKLGWISLANDAASELAYPIVPLFLTVTLGAPVAIVGPIEGIAEAIATGVRLLSGWVSDRTGDRRKPWIIGGYGASTVARAMLAAAPGWGLVLAGRIVDRFGKGARSTPRDALNDVHASLGCRSDDGHDPAIRNRSGRLGGRVPERHDDGPGVDHAGMQEPRQAPHHDPAGVVS